MLENLKNTLRVALGASAPTMVTLLALASVFFVAERTRTLLLYLVVFGEHHFWGEGLGFFEVHQGI